jgi:hypothetical protein
MPFKEIIGNKVMHTCDACSTVFQMGQGLYEGTNLREIEMTVCRACGPDDMSDRARKAAIERLRFRAVEGGQKKT